LRGLAVRAEPRLHLVEGHAVVRGDLLQRAARALLRRLLGGRCGLGGGLGLLLPRRRGGGGRRGRCDGVALDLDGAGCWHTRGGAGGSRPLRGLGNVVLALEVQQGTVDRRDDADGYVLAHGDRRGELGFAGVAAVHVVPVPCPGRWLGEGGGGDDGGPGPLRLDAVGDGGEVAGQSVGLRLRVGERSVGGHGVYVQGSLWGWCRVAPGSGHRTPRGLVGVAAVQNGGSTGYCPGAGGCWYCGAWGCGAGAGAGAWGCGAYCG